MKPILYEASETEFKSNGMGRLSDAISCKVVEERNGQYELEMKYPVTGIHYEDLIEERIIASRHDDTDDIQPFRIYKITRPMNGQVEVNARHISYQLSKVAVMPMTANGCAASLAAMKENSVGDNPFTFWTDKTVDGKFAIHQPVSFRSFLGGTAGSILDIFGPGEYEWDKYTVKFHSHRGSDSGVTIRYDKNLTDVKKTTNSSGIWTGIVPFWYGMDENESEILVTLPEKAVYAETVSDYAYRMVVPIDFSGTFESVPSVEQLRTTAEAYVRNNADTSIPSSIDVSFVNLWQTEEYKDVAPLQRLKLCDTVTIHHRTLGIENRAKIVSVTYDVLLERYTTMTIGEVRTSLGEAIQEAVSGASRNDVATLTSMELAIRHATDVLSGALGGNVKIQTNVSGQPIAIYVMDTADYSTARKILRFNQSGIAFTTGGSSGSYTTICSMDGKIPTSRLSGNISADIITTGILNASLMTTGELKVSRAGKEKFYVNLATGIVRIVADSFSMANGDTIESVAETAAQSALAQALPDAVESAVAAQVIDAAGDAVSEALPIAVSNAVDAAVPAAVNNAVSSAVPTAVNAAVSDALSGFPLELFGGGTIGEEGTCTITIDEGFEATDVYYVFLQKEGEGDLWISAKAATGFTVSGTVGIAFAWNLKYQHSQEG